MKDNILIFDFLDEDRVCSHVKANFTTGEVSVENFTDIVVMTVFGVNKPTIDGLLEFFEERVFPETRPDSDVLLKMLGLREYNPLDICRKTHGKCWEDDMWIRFDGENLDWNTVKNMLP